MTTKKFVKLQFIFAIILAITIISGTFSWAPRPKVQGGAFMSQSTNGDASDTKYYTAMSFITPANGYYVNGKGCTATTYKGTLNTTTGEVEYDTSTAITSFSQTLAASEVVYFKTEITNSAAVATNTSLFINGKYRQTLQGDFRIGVTSPVSKESFMTTDISNNDGTYINYKWYSIVSQYEIDASGTAHIEWFIRNTNTTTSGAFEISKIILTNN